MKTTQRLEQKILSSLGIDIGDEDPIWCPARQIIITGGWRAGKSTRGAGRALRQVLRPNFLNGTPNGLIWLIGPDYVQAKAEFLYLVDWCQRLNLYSKHTQPADGQCTLVTKTGWRIETKSARYAERLGSVAPDGIVLCEPGQMNEEVYSMALGRLAQKRGWLMAVGTLEAEDGQGHPRWLWYEDLANKWKHNLEGMDKRSFTLPSWTNKKEFPLGENDPKLLDLKEALSPYTYARKVRGEPVGVEHACFPELWMEDAEERYGRSLQWSIINEKVNFIDGAFGVDYGSSPDHPSSIVVLQIDQYGRIWVRDCWMETGGNYQQIDSAVEARRRLYGVFKGRVDPHQAVLAQRLGFEVALGSGPAPTDARIGMMNGTIQDGLLIFDLDNPEVDKVFRSMKMMRRKRDMRNRLIYARDLGDDAGQAALYAMEELRGFPLFLPEVGKLGGMRESWARTPSRAQLVGRS